MRTTPRRTAASTAAIAAITLAVCANPQIASAELPAWPANPNWQIDPGCATWQVKPHPGTLAWAQGQVPTPRGALTVRWAQDTARQFHLQVISPAGTGGEVWVPLASAAGTSAPLTPGATFLRRNGNYDVYRVGAGTFEFNSAQ